MDQQPVLNDPTSVKPLGGVEAGGGKGAFELSTLCCPADGIEQCGTAVDEAGVDLHERGPCGEFSTGGGFVGDAADGDDGQGGVLGEVGEDFG